MGWATKRIEPNIIEAKLYSKNRYTAIVLIQYDEKGYKITYKSSVNLKYNAESNTIHSNYNRWIAGLSKSIDKILINIDSIQFKKEIKQIDLSGKIIYVKPNAIFGISNDIAQDIKEKCSIDTQIINYIVENAKKYDVNIIIKDEIPIDAIELKITIENAVSRKNAVGFTKNASYSGKIIKDNITYFSIVASRRSVNSVFGNQEGQCPVFRKINSSIGRDIGIWLSNPIDNVKLGD